MDHALQARLAVAAQVAKSPLSLVDAKPSKRSSKTPSISRSESRSEPSVMISLHSAHRALLVLARSIWVISGRSVGLRFRAVVCAQARQASRYYSPHRCGARGGADPLSGWHTGFEISFDVGALPMILPACGVISALAAVSSAMGAAT